MYIASLFALLLFFLLSAPGLTASADAQHLLANDWRPDTGLWSSARVSEFEALDSRAEIGVKAVLRIPELNIKVPIYDASNPNALRLGLEHVANTADIESGFNIGLAGHRDGFFRSLKDARLGQKIQLSTREVDQQYVVTDIEIVNPDEIAVLATSSYRKLTLITCYPFYFVGHAPQRFIVHAQLVDSQPR